VARWAKPSRLTEFGTIKSRLSALETVPVGFFIAIVKKNLTL
jgi:hypothetical protein